MNRKLLALVHTILYVILMTVAVGGLFLMLAPKAGAFELSCPDLAMAALNGSNSGAAVGAWRCFNPTMQARYPLERILEANAGFPTGLNYHLVGSAPASDARTYHFYTTYRDGVSHWYVITTDAEGRVEEIE